MKGREVGATSSRGTLWTGAKGKRPRDVHIDREMRYVDLKDVRLDSFYAARATLP